MTARLFTRMMQLLACLVVCSLCSFVVASQCEDCEKVFNCAAKQEEHEISIEFSPRRFPSSGSVNFRDIALKLPKGFPHPFESIIFFYELYKDDVHLLSGSYRLSCDEIEKHLPTWLQVTCPPPKAFHPPFHNKRGVSFNKAITIPQGFYRAHVEVLNEKQYLEFCFEFGVEFYEGSSNTSSDPSRSNSNVTTTYKPIDIVPDLAEQKPSQSGGKTGSNHDAQPVESGAGNIVSLISEVVLLSCGLWLIRLCLN